MAVYALGDRVPRIDPSAWVHESASVIGEVTLGPGVSVWPGAVLRGDYGSIVVEAGGVVEDNCVLHAARETPLRVGAEAVLGHAVHIEGCTIGDAVLVGSGAVVLSRAVVETGAMVAAGALVPPGFVVPDGFRAQGVPARLVERGRFAPEDVRRGAATYRANAERYRQELVRVDR